MNRIPSSHTRAGIILRTALLGALWICAVVVGQSLRYHRGIDVNDAVIGVIAWAVYVALICLFHTRNRR